MNKLLIVSILQSGGNLFDVRHYHFDRHERTARVALAKGSIGSVLHYQKRDRTLDPEVEHAHNIGVEQMRDCASFAAEMFNVVIDQASAQHLDCSQCIEMDMIAEINVCESPLSNKLKNSIVPQ